MMLPLFTTEAFAEQPVSVGGFDKVVEVVVVDVVVVVTTANV